jgi:hypothetical protein
MSRGMHSLQEGRTTVRQPESVSHRCFRRRRLGPRELMKAHDVGQILQKVETGQRRGWKDIADRSSVYKRYWVQWICLVVSDGMLERHWDSADGRTETAQTVVPRSKVKEILTERHGRLSEGHLGVSKILHTVRRRYYWLHSRNNFERWYQQCDTSAARTPNQELGPDKPTQRRSTVGKNPHRHRRILAGEREREPLPSDCHGLVRQVARSLCHPYSIGINRGRFQND